MEEAMRPAVDPYWYTILNAGPEPGHLSWLSQLKGFVNSIADFGCWSDEPLVLMWTLDATEVVVVERDPANLSRAKEDRDLLERTVPDALRGRSLRFIVADMTEVLDEARLRSDHFDLAYCERVLYHMSDPTQVQVAVSEMARTVKPGGRVIAVESMPDQQGNPRLGILAPLFEKAGLLEENLDNAPEDAHCYRKPRSR